MRYITLEQHLGLIFEGAEDQYSRWMAACDADASGALQSFMDDLATKAKKTKSKAARVKSMKLVKMIQAILADPTDRSNWQGGARSFEDAAKFLISNTIMSILGLGVRLPD